MPHLAELVQLHKDRDFALIGINAFDDEEAFHKGVEEFGVNWTVAYQADSKAPICDLFRVQAYPTIFVLDPEGRIAATGLRGESLAAKVAEMLDAHEQPAD
ncbi:Thiol-disulfide oxidoreductase ResA [Planctomycetes bacterium Pla86]|uniref:Thiol-disulfide oxidoreductase ResA n=1 Tax=Engelhardtia mirabilis TaxID=2528011 RepID=A0A518BEW6_9BACT|nr:Thiol-disulfide oxidoreductase ResA [Planctomycetes bacterium Pla133]QDU99854.1 Thiol-disulfide oxidoreductase ResA [Planctomycetes bacterium Pla86]